MKKITILLVDDHTVIRHGLRTLLSNETDFEIVGEASSGREAFALVASLRPNVIIMDLSMPLLNGMEATRQITLACPSAKIIVLSAYQDAEHVERALGAGASAYVLKHSAAMDLIQAIRDVEAGNAYFSPAISELLRKSRLMGNKPQPARNPSLTIREAEVLQLIVEGFPNKQIASELNLSIKTIEKHRQTLMQKLNLHCVADLVRHAMEKGIIESPVALGQVTA